MRFPSRCGAAPPPTISSGGADGMVRAPFAIVPNPTAPSATTRLPDDDAVAAVPPRKFPPSSRLGFYWKVARRSRQVVLYPSLASHDPQNPFDERPRLKFSTVNSSRGYPSA